MKQTVIIPYYRSHPTSKVLFSEDTQVGLYENHMTIRVNSVEEIPKDTDDPYLGVREKVRKATVTILRSAVLAIETSWDSEFEAFDVNIFTYTTCWGYNFADREKAVEVYGELTAWLLSCAT